jgi:UDP-glucuronate decarboxylase
MRNKIIKEDLDFITKTDLPWEQFMEKTVLISGASGFLPAYMVETFLYLNEIRGLNTRILGIVRDGENAQKRFSSYLQSPHFELIIQDICEPVQIKEGVDYIIHAASQASPKYFYSDPVGTIKPNVLGTYNLLKLASEKKICSFLYFSTTGVYGNVPPDSYPLKEDYYGYVDPLNIASSYIESKKMGENLCIAWMHQYGIKTKIVRPAITYGPGVRLDDGRSFADFINNILKKENIELFSEGKVYRNYCYLADATLGFFTVLLRGQSGEAYNIANPKEIAVIELAKLLTEQVFPELNLKVVLKADQSKSYLRMNFPRTAVDISKAESLGWKISFGLIDGFKRTVNSFLVS